MINEQKERDTLTKMSDLEYHKNDTEMMRYRVNSLPYKLGLGGMVCFMIAGFLQLNSMCASMSNANFNVLVVVMLVIVVLLGGFLAAEKVKSYNKGGAIAEIVFGGVSIINIFYIPLIIIINYSTFIDYKTNVNTTVTEEQYNQSLKWLGATITAEYNNSTAAVSFLPSSGTFRGVTAIVFLVAAAALFIAAGIIGYLKSQKLSRYLESINQKK